METGGYGCDRGQSEVLGYGLLLAITMLGVTTVVAFGGAAITDLEHSAEVKQTEIAMTQFDSQTARVALGSQSSQQLALGGKGRISVNETAGHITISTVNSTAETTLIDEDFGAVTYQVSKTTFAYQGGGVWQQTNNGSVMVSPPEYHYRGQTLTFPIIRITGETWEGPGDTTLRVNRTGFEQEYPTASRSNPLEDGHVRVKVNSEYHEGWAAYFRDRTDGKVQHYPSNNTAMVNLTVPYIESFTTAVAATDDDSDAITTTGNAQFDSPQRVGANRPSASPKIDTRITTCESGGCADLSSELADNTLENGTFYHDGDITLGPAVTYDTNAGRIHVVINGDLTFTGSGGPGTTDHVVTGGKRVTFYVKGDVNINGNAAVNTGGDSGDVVVLVHSDAGEIAAASGTPQFTGLIYAPNSSLRINGGGACGTGGPPGGCAGNIVGAIVVRNAKAVGSGKLNYAAPPGFEMEFESSASITYLHITDNRINVTRA